MNISIKTQSGVALMMSLVILLIMSILGASSMQGSIMQERMSTASRESALALEAAEAGLREAEAILGNLKNMDNFGNADGTGNKNGWYHIGYAPPFSMMEPGITRGAKCSAPTPSMELRRGTLLNTADW